MCDLMSYKQSPKQEKHHEHIGFSGLEKKVYDEYRRKGYSKEIARKYAKETAGKVYWERRKKVTV